MSSTESTQLKVPYTMLYCAESLSILRERATNLCGTGHSLEQLMP